MGRGTATLPARASGGPALSARGTARYRPPANALVSFVLCIGAHSGAATIYRKRETPGLS